MKYHLACVMAAAAVLSLAACGGGGDSVSERALTVGEIRELTGLSAPVETGEAAQARSPDIFPRADSLILSTIHGETGNAEFPAFRHATQCSGTQCTVTEPLSGAVDTIELANTPSQARRRHRHRLEARHHPSVGVLDAYGRGPCQSGSMAGHGTFAILNERQTGEEGTVDVWYGIGVGDLTDRPLTGSATWLGIMVGTPIAGDDRGDRPVRRPHPGWLLRSRPRRGGGHLRAVRHRRRLRREAAVGTRSRLTPSGYRTWPSRFPHLASVGTRSLLCGRQSPIPHANRTNTRRTTCGPRLVMDLAFAEVSFPMSSPRATSRSIRETWESNRTCKQNRRKKAPCFWDLDELEGIRENVPELWCGSGGGTRTPDPWIMIPLLYRLSYPASGAGSAPLYAAPWPPVKRTAERAVSPSGAAANRGRRRRRREH